MSKIIQPGVNPMDAKLPPHMKRVMEEGDELAERLTKLKHFIAGPGFKSVDAESANLMVIQGSVMEAYLRILAMRLNVAREDASLANPGFKAN